MQDSSHTTQPNVTMPLAGLRRRERSLTTLYVRIFQTAMEWQRRASERAHLRELETCFLDDVGITPEQRDREVEKPFWKR